MKKQFQTKKIALAVALSLGASLVVAQSGPIKIGVVTPLSGTYTPIGEQVKMGLDLAAKEINAAGGINGRKINLIYEPFLLIFFNFRKINFIKPWKKYF